MALVELVEWILGYVLSGGLATYATALAVLLVGAWYAREISAFLVGISRWMKMGGMTVLVVGVLMVAGLATGALALDGGIVERLLQLLEVLVGAVGEVRA